MGKKYTQLTYEDRIIIYVLLKEKRNPAYIAEHLGVPRSKITREIERNSGKRGYRPKQAQQKADARRHQASCKKSTADTDLQSYIKCQLEYGLSPEQIAGRMPLDDDYHGPYACTQTIYNYIAQDKRDGGEMYTCLRIANGKKRRKKARGKPDNRGSIKNRVDISMRPKEANERTEIGHMEADLVCGAHHKGFIVTVNDRATGEFFFGHVERKTADAVADELIRILQHRKHETKTITFDNGKEFAGHERIAKALDCSCYFARPYHSQDRGSNENGNGLLRQYFPKGTDLRRVTAKELKFAQDRMNNRPRKRYGYLTPNEVYLQRLAS